MLRHQISLQTPRMTAKNGSLKYSTELILTFLSRDQWTFDDEEALFELVYRHNKDWGKIAHEFLNTQHRRAHVSKGETAVSLSKKYTNLISKTSRYSKDKTYKHRAWKPERGQPKADQVLAKTRFDEHQDDLAQRFSKV